MTDREANIAAKAAPSQTSDQSRLCYSVEGSRDELKSNEETEAEIANKYFRKWGPSPTHA